MAVDIGTRLRCLRCGHEWNARSSRKPVQCPGCKSTSWDRPRPSPGGARPSKGEAPDFTRIPAFGMWRDRPESDEALLRRLGSGFAGATKE